MANSNQLKINCIHHVFCCRLSNSWLDPRTHTSCRNFTPPDYKLQTLSLTSSFESPPGLFGSESVSNGAHSLPIWSKSRSSKPQHPLLAYHFKSVLQTTLNSARSCLSLGATIFFFVSFLIVSFLPLFSPIPSHTTTICIYARLICRVT